MNYLIIGGSKSGKSKIGEQISLKLSREKVIYIATMKPYDLEDEKRINKHIQSRKHLNFVTIEKERNLKELVNIIDKGDTLLIDSITSLLNNEMFIKNEIISKPSIEITDALVELMNKAKNTVIISDYIFNDSIEYDNITENYKRELAIINKKLAKICNKVFECSFGNGKCHK